MPSNAALRNEVFGIYPLRDSDVTDVKTEVCRGQINRCFRVEQYQYADNDMRVAIVDINLDELRRSRERTARGASR